MYNQLELKGMNVDYYSTLNEVLVNLFRDITAIEERAIASSEFPNLTNNDMHVIEAIGIGKAKNMSTVARALSVTVGTLTIAINSLVKKGYVVRERGKEDRRVVFISLSAMGRKAYGYHQGFHKAMIQSIMEELDHQEMEVLARSLDKLNDWFRSLDSRRLPDIMKEELK